MKVRVTRVSDSLSKPISECYMGKDNYNNTIWLLDVDSMTDLMDIISKYGSVIIHKGKKYPLIMIYDDYVE